MLSTRKHNTVKSITGTLKKTSDQTAKATNNNKKSKKLSQTTVLRTWQLSTREVWRYTQVQEKDIHGNIGEIGIKSEVSWGQCISVIL